MVDFDKEENVAEDILQIIEKDDFKKEEVKKLRIWMFQEQVRIQAKKDELFDLSCELQEERRNLEREKTALQLKEKAVKKRFDENEIFIAKKKKIIEDAYQQLALDRKALECERLNFEHERVKYKRQRMAAGRTTYQHENTGMYDGSCFFRGCANELELRKRYKELLKIFHPDNQCGDTKTLLLIQTEYERLRRKYEEA